MNHIQALKISKSYAVPSWQITWSITKHTLNLEAIIDKHKYETGSLSLPPTELGKCKDWCLQNGDGVYGFNACWEIRRVKDSLNLIDIVNSKIEPYAVQREAQE
jgi:hypothetical protein